MRSRRRRRYRLNKKWERIWSKFFQPPPLAPVVVEIMPHRGVNPGEWQFMERFSTLAEAEDYVAYHKEIDEMPPVGHYSYRIITP